MITLSVLIIIAYGLLIGFFILGFDRVFNFHAEASSVKKAKFSIIIPFRNEAINLPALLQSIKNIHYPENKFEVIFVNDASNDAYEQILQSFKIQNPGISSHLLNNIRKSNSPKKDAIETAIKTATFDWIITTDADCLLPKNWLITLDAFIQKESPKMIVAPVTYSDEKSFFAAFQLLDFMSLQGSTIGGFGFKKPFLCNGANLCYDKKSFFEIKAFEGNESIGSGDDIFILEKMVQHFPLDVKYLKSEEAIVKTQAVNTFSELVQQRIRWASKTSAYQNSFGKLVGTIVFATNVLLVFLFFLAILNLVNWQYLGLVFLVKFNIDFILLLKTATFFRQQPLLKKYFFSSLIHPFFIVFTGLLSLGKGYQWKGRKFSK